MQSAQQNALEYADRLDADSRADFFNQLAWYDERPGELTLTRDGRGRIARLEGAYLAYDFAPHLSQQALRERALAFFAPGGFGRVLLDLSESVDVRLQRRLLGRTARFLVQQFHENRQVLGAAAVLTLDREGHLAGLDAALVDSVSPEKGAAISEREVFAIAIEHVQAIDDSLWRGVDPVAESLEKIVFDLFPTTGRDEFRYAFLVTLVPAGGVVGGRREVVVDELTGEVLASIEKAKLQLDRNDEIKGVAGEIGCGSTTPEETLWSGEEACTPANAPPTGATALLRDEDEIRATLCEVERFFAARGGEFGSSDFHDWIDQNNSGLKVGIGATPVLSIGINSGGLSPFITLAEGAGRAEIVGHEFAHSLFGTDGSVAAFSGGGFDGDGAAIEEHMADLLGMLVEYRFPGRNENRCLQSDDPDTLQAANAIETDAIPCRGQELFWRSICAPQRENAGWCEGPRTFLDKAFKRYDIGYPRSELCGTDPLAHGLSHTNLGIGNRPAAALFKDTGLETLIEGFRVQGLGQPARERLYLGAATNLPRMASWSSYAKAWIDAAREIDVSTTRPASPTEPNVRAALAGAKIWSVRRPLALSSGVLSEATRGTRPAVASLVLEDGRERTYVFYRPSDFSETIQYVWRNEVAGGVFADESDAAFQGPCRLGEARSLESPAAAARDGKLYVAWAEPTEEPEVGIVMGLRLLAENAAREGCGDGWEFHPPGLREGGEGPAFVERRLKGAPSLAIWRSQRATDPPPVEELVTCDLRLSSPIPRDLPRFPIGPLGPASFLWDRCRFRPSSPQLPPRPLPPEFTVRFRDLLLPVINSRSARALPSILDPLSPARDLNEEELLHGFSLETDLRTDRNLRAQFEDLMTSVGVIEQNTEPSAGSAEPRLASRAAALPNPGFIGLNPRFRVKYILPDGPPVVVFAPAEDRLVLAFRDLGNRLRAVDYQDASPTDDSGEDMPLIPVLAENVNETDPAMASVRMTPDQEYLTVVYGVEHNGQETGLAYRTMLNTNSDGLWDATLFTEQRRIDQIRGKRRGALRRRVDYAYARTKVAAAATGGNRSLHLFAVELSHDEEAAEGDPDAPGYDPFPDSSASRSDHLNHIRYAVLNMTSEGMLRAGGERPARLAESNIVSTAARLRPGRVSQVGAAQMLQRRRIIRFYFPNGAEMGVKSRVVR